MTLAAVTHPGAALALLQGERGVEFSFETLIQGVIIFVFFLLPVLKSVFEVRKRKAAERGAPRPPARNRRAELEKTGRDLWRELIGGEQPSEPKRPQVPPPSVRPAAAPRAQQRRGQPGERSVTLEHEAAEAALARQRKAEAARRAASRALEAMPQRAADQELGSLRTSVAPGGMGRLESGVAARMGDDHDPSSLDEEILARWGAQELADAPAPAALLELHGHGVDWRRAVLLSELLAPPLALRERSGAWPGPPAALQG